MLFINLSYAQEVYKDYKDFYKSGKLKTLGKLTNNNNEVGEWKTYYENGKIATIKNYNLTGDIIGDWKQYHKTGGLKSIGKINNNGKLIGKWKWYYKTGYIKVIGEFDENGNHNGDWMFFYPNNTLRKNLYYKNGKLMEVISYFDIKGNPINKGTLINGNGTVRYYNLEEEFIEEIIYIDGIEKK